MYDRYTYRGLREDNGEWIYGYYHSVTKGGHLCPVVNAHFIKAYKRLDNGEIILTECRQINPATLGQCTGIPVTKSCRGNKPEDLIMFEGDRVYISEWQTDGVVRWYRGGWMIMFVDDDADYLNDIHDMCEIVGNIHDNPGMAGGAGWREVPHEAD